MRVCLTHAGRTLIDDALTAHFDNEARLLASLDKVDQERIADQLRRLIVLLSREVGPIHSRRSVPRPRRNPR